MIIEILWRRLLRRGSDIQNERICMKNILDVKLDPDKVYEAIAEGVDRAIWRMINNATAMPCQDFYDTIEKAAREAFEKVAVRVGEPKD